MKSNSILLLKVLLQNQFKFNQLKQKSNKQKMKLILISFAYLLVIAMLVAYSFLMGYSLGIMGIANIIPGYGITIVSLITLFFTIFKSNGILFGNKDYEMMISLPIKTSEIIKSRFLHMYLMNTLFAFVVMIPLGISYSIFVKPQGIFYLIWLCGITFSTLLPTTLAALLGAIIAYIASHFKYTNAFATILSLLLVIGILISSFGMGGLDQKEIDMTQLTKLGEILSSELNKWYPMSGIFQKAVIHYDIGYLLSFIAISLGWYILFIKALSFKYKAINTAILTHSTRSNYKIEQMKESSALMALYRKERKRFFSSYACVLNQGMGVIMAFIMTIAIVVFKIEKLEAYMQIPHLENVLVKVIALVFSGVLAMSCTTAVSLSLEGKNLWILKSLPITVKTIVDSKILVNLTITLPIAFIFGTLMNIKFQTDIITRLFFYFIPLVYSFFIAVWGMFINIKFPNYEWESETHLIKQGLASMLGMLGGPVFAILPIFIILVLPKVSYQFLQVIVILVIACFTSALYQKVIRCRL